jgi:hypothetical protein
MLRFRRSFRIAPGIRMNFSGSGASLSVGPRGASMTFGRRGTFLNAGIPGTGFSARQRLDSPSRPERSASRPAQVTMSARVVVDDDGTIKFLDMNGDPLPPEWVNRAKRQNGEAIRNLIQDCCDKINERVEALGSIHLHTPWPHERITYEPLKFEAAKPVKPTPKTHGFLGWLFKSVRARIDTENARRQSHYELKTEEWETAKREFEAAERARKELLEVRVLSEVVAMEEVLEGALKAITWPRETEISAEVSEDGLSAMLDVDLPELEDMPKTTASVPGRGYKLSVKEMSLGKIQKLYMQHVHSIGFRIIGETFAVLPTVQQVTLSAFSQRPDKSTGAIGDEYLYSVRAKRDGWVGIAFNNLAELDVIAALERYELVRDMTKNGVFRPVAPLAIHPQQSSQVTT